MVVPAPTVKMEESILGIFSSWPTQLWYGIPAFVPHPLVTLDIGSAIPNLGQWWYSRFLSSCSVIDTAPQKYRPSVQPESHMYCITRIIPQEIFKLKWRPRHLVCDRVLSSPAVKLPPCGINLFLGFCGSWSVKVKALLVDGCFAYRGF